MSLSVEKFLKIIREAGEAVLEIEKVGLAGSPTIVAAAPKVEKATRDLQITDAEGLESVVEGWQ